MKIKYFIRGLGFGILITAIILGISYKSKNSDEDVILKAKKLGMVFAEDASGSALGTDGIHTSNPAVKEEATTIPEQADEPAAEQSEQPAPEKTDKPRPKQTEDAAEETSAPKNKPTDEPEQVSFLIEKGDWSHIVSEKLEKLDIIDDAKEFDKYLVDNGYAVRIKVGKFSAKKGASYEEVAKIISK